jgi:hypothetical protein
LIGGIAFGQGNSNYLKWFIENNKQRKSHWLGFTNIDFIKKYKPESVDSSSWQSAGRFGNLSVYSGGGNLISVSRKSVIKDLNSPRSFLRIHSHRIGVSVDELSLLLHPLSWTGTAAGRMHDLKIPSKGLAYFLGACANIIRAHEVETRIGTKVYLACSLADQLRMLDSGRQFLKSRLPQATKP